MAQSLIDNGTYEMGDTSLTEVLSDGSEIDITIRCTCDEQEYYPGTYDMQGHAKGVMRNEAVSCILYQRNNEDDYTDIDITNQLDSYEFSYTCALC